MQPKSPSKQAGFALIVGLLLACVVIGVAAVSYARYRRIHSAAKSTPTPVAQSTLPTPHPGATPAPGTTAPTPTPKPTATRGPGTTAQPQPSSAPGYITEADNGATFQVKLGQSLYLDLSTKQWVWDYPVAKPNIVGITAVNYFTDPGYSEWVIKADTPGTITISTTGSPHCSVKPEAACPDSLTFFKVTLVLK